jgi:hypothetical protein
LWLYPLEYEFSPISTADLIADKPAAGSVTVSTRASVTPMKIGGVSLIAIGGVILSSHKP